MIKALLCGCLCGQPSQFLRCTLSLVPGQTCRQEQQQLHPSTRMEKPLRSESTWGWLSVTSKEGSLDPRVHWVERLS